MITFFVIGFSILGCTPAPGGSDSTPLPTNEVSTPISPTTSPAPEVSASPAPLSTAITSYAFPSVIDPAKRYLYYLHGKIIEDQGIPAVSPDFGEYEYQAILEKLSGYGFIVISEQRPPNTDGLAYAVKVKEQITTLIAAGVPAANITVVGASKGAGITIEISHLLKNAEVNYVIMAICHPDIVEDFKQDQIFLTGNVLSIYDSIDEWAGSCEGLFSYSTGKGLSRHAEIVLKVGTGHGVLYKPLDEWILPTVEWANGDYR